MSASTSIAERIAVASRSGVRARPEPATVAEADALERAIEALPAAALLVDATGRVGHINGLARQRLGLGAAGTVSAPLARLLADLPPGQSRDFAAGGGGATIQLRAAATPVAGHLIVLVEDLAVPPKIAEHLRHGDRLASMGTLAAGMAHEIKNPLQTLKTFAQLMPDRYDDPEFRAAFTELIGQEVQRIENLVGQLLRFARPPKPQFARLHANDVVSHTLRLLGQQIRQREIGLELAAHAPSDVVMGDADLIQQAVVNLVLNALEALQHGGKVTVTTDVLRRVRNPRGTFFRLSVRDTGPGIAAGDLPRIFDPFFTTKREGTGLGLSVTQGIATDHGGRLEVESAPGVGTTFHLLLPLAGGAK